MASTFRPGGRDAVARRGPLVELCAGLASVTLRTLGLSPPVSRVGAKTGYTTPLLAALGIERPGAVAAAILVDTDPLITTVLSCLLRCPDEVADRVACVTGCAPYALWLDCRAALRPGARMRSAATLAATWLLFTAGARGGVGGFKGRHCLRPSVDGFIPARAAMVDRLRAFARVAAGRRAAVSVECADARDVAVVPGARVLIDPPYDGRLGYVVRRTTARGARDGVGGLSRADVLALARKWRAGGAASVVVCEGAPLASELGAGWESRRIERTGQARRSLTTSTEEWVTTWRAG